VKEILMKREQYKTEKLIFAAYLIAADRAKLIGTTPNGDGRTVTFRLTNPPTDEDIAAFFNGSAQVSALRFAEALNTLKGIAYEARRRSR
jgi:hypothetical protein